MNIKDYNFEEEPKNIVVDKDFLEFKENKNAFVYSIK